MKLIIFFIGFLQLTKCDIGQIADGRNVLEMFLETSDILSAVLLCLDEMPKTFNGKMKCQRTLAKLAGRRTKHEPFANSILYFFLPEFPSVK